jgi:5'-nucleotidase
MLILVSNDDGFFSPGIKKLTNSLKKIPNVEVVVVAPNRERSAASHALTLHRPLRIEKVSKGIYAVDGTPTDSVMLAVHKILDKKPDIIVSGINRGGNVGEDVHYSGTVSAAVEGAIMGIPGIAVSVIGNQKPFKYDVAASFAKKLTALVLKKKLPKGLVLNVNVPNLPKDEIKEVRVTKLGKHNYGDVIVENTDPRGRAYYWIGGDPFDFGSEKGTDTKAELDRCISVTPIKVDMTDRSFLTKMKSWDLSF